MAGSRGRPRGQRRREVLPSALGEADVGLEHAGELRGGPGEAAFGGHFRGERKRRGAARGGGRLHLQRGGRAIGQSARERRPRRTRGGYLSRGGGLQLLQGARQPYEVGALHPQRRGPRVRSPAARGPRDGDACERRHREAGKA